MDEVEWSNYGTESGNPRCANCMVHSGYEASGVNYTFGSLKGLMQTAKAMFRSEYKDDHAQKHAERVAPDEPWQAGPDRLRHPVGRGRAGEPRRVAGGGGLMATDQQEHLKIEQLHGHNPDELEVMAGRERENLEGWIPALATESETRDALEKAFDYRGDVTLTLRSGEVVEGYVYDRRAGSTLSDSLVRMMPSKGEDRGRRNIAYGEIAAVNFSGRDTAAGKTFEAWVKKYWEKKAAGETNIQIEPEKLD